MMNTTRALYLILLAILLAACATGETEQPTTVTPAVNTPARPTPWPVLTPVATETTAAQATDPAGGEGALEGRLYYVGFSNDGQQLLMLDLASGEEMAVFAVPRDAWLSEVTASPAGDQLLLAYAPPPEGNQVQFGFTALYLMPADGSNEPELLLPQADPSESFFNISWPLDDTIYYAHYALSIDELGVVTYASQIERAHLPGVEVEVLVADAAWPRLSNDGARLAYVTEAEELMIAAADGSAPRFLLGPESFSAVDAPLFSPAGDQLYFSAVDLVGPAASLSPLDRLLGVKVAQAHSVPSDWWRLPDAAGLESERLTTIDKIGLYGDFSADGDHLYFVAADGVYVMGPAGQEITQLQSIPTASTIDWTP